MSDSLALRRIVAPPSCMAARHGVRGRWEGRVGSLYGAAPPTRRLFATIRRAAATEASALILGESGSRRQLVARAIHAASPRRDGPFVVVNCGALRGHLIESELFGHERGSFTGALRTHHGGFERARGGTLFLDDIVAMPIELQVRLLRVLETGRYARVGGDAELSSDARVIAASNRDLPAAVAAGRLRKDLMHRLCVIPIVVPPLREREGDALLHTEMSLAGLNAPGSPGEASDALGPDALRIPIGTRLDEAERALILATLAAVSGSKVKAAQALGISLKTLYNRLHAYRAAASAEPRPDAPLPLSEAA